MACPCDSDSDPAAARHPVSPRRHGGHGDFTEAPGFSVHLRVLRVLRVSVVNKVLEYFLSLASQNSSRSHDAQNHKEFSPSSARSCRPAVLVLRLSKNVTLTTMTSVV